MSAPAPPPPVRLVDIQIAKSTDGGSPSGYVAIAPDGSTADVVATTSFRLTFDRFLLPTATFRQSVCLQPVLGAVTAAKDCARGITLEPAYDPVLRRITYRQPATSAGLAPSTRYTISVFPPPSDGTTNGILAFDGAPLDHAASFDFTTRDSEPAGTTVEPAPSVDFCAALDHDVFKGSCAAGGCHTSSGPADHGVVLGAAEGLDFSSNAALHATAVSRVAHETQTGEHADQGESNPSRFGRAMPIIDPRRPGNSYLLYKLLASERNGAPGSDAAAEKARVDEIARLRAAVVVGMPMPPADGASEPVNQLQLEQISDWILSGAATDCP